MNAMSPPKVRIDREPESRLLTLVFEGAVGVSLLQQAQSEITRAAEHMGVDGVVIDARRSRPDYSPAALIEAVERTLETVAPRRCALVAAGERSRELMLIETVSFPYAVRVRAFSCPEDARTWALGLD